MSETAAAEQGGYGLRRAAIGSDIPSGMTYHQGFVVERPMENGSHWVLVDLLVDGQSLGKFNSFDLVVRGGPF